MKVSAIIALVVVAVVLTSLFLHSWIPILLMFLFPIIMLLVAGVAAAFVSKSDVYFVINSPPSHDHYNQTGLDEIVDFHRDIN